MTPGNIHDKRFVKLENVLASDFIPFLAGRPVRQECINHDDETNLKIVLNLTKTVGDFLDAM